MPLLAMFHSRLGCVIEQVGQHVLQCDSTVPNVVIIDGAQIRVFDRLYNLFSKGPGYSVVLAPCVGVYVEDT
jgi:hypothetical protein